MTAAENTDSCLDAALSYAALGLRVIPIQPGTKHPGTISRWQYVATTDASVVRSWWAGLYRGWGVGIVTGPESGVWALDVDVADGKTGDETLADLEREHGDLPETVEALTARGGRHLFYLWPAGVEVRGGQHSLGYGLDVRGVGGQVLVEPSIGPEGGAYRWVVDHAPGEIPFAEAPAWLLDLLAQRSSAPLRAPAAPSTDVGTRPGDLFAEATSWADLLEADGWTHVRTVDGVEEWTRPDKDPRLGISATVNYGGADTLKVFTSSVAGLVEGATYSKLGYVAATRYAGDHHAAASALRAQGFKPDPMAWVSSLSTVEGADPVDEGDALDAIAHVVNWPELWETDYRTEDWLIYPLVPRGRAVALYAPAKAGKSTVLLAAVAAATTGRPILGHRGRAVDPIRVLYLDFEMTATDLVERLGDLGYGREDDLDRLTYALLPSLPPLDTAEGAAAVVELARRHEVELVVVDTFGRAVEGEEDRADTVRSFYRFTGLALKAAGIAVVRVDHAGKDLAKGQRGSSAKTEDVDVVWQLTRDERSGDLTIRRTHSRIAWAPQVVTLRRTENEKTGVVEFVHADLFPTGTADVVARFEALGIPIRASRKEVRRLLDAAGEKCSNEMIAHVRRWRESAEVEAWRSSVHERTAGGPPLSSTTYPQADRSGPDPDRLANMQVTDPDRPPDRLGPFSGVDSDRGASISKWTPSDDDRNLDDLGNVF